tara:strand:+ start:868 stop:2550 length:1683 start_codon:yes stop_codon:yes gene_type:complete
MLTNLIENRGKEFSNLVKIGDYLARTLRENVELFNVEDGKATYLTESGSVISGKYTFSPTLKLTKVVVEDASVLEDRKSFEDATVKKVSLMLSNLMESDYTKADGSFDRILSMYETQLSYERIKKRLEEKVERFGEQGRIVSSPEFQRVNEIKDQLVEFLADKNLIKESASIRNGVKLSTLVSTSFDLPKMNVEQIAENKSFEVKTIGKQSLYEHLCRKELIQKELLEARQSFDKIWVDNNSIQDLAAMIYESDEDNIRHQVAQVVSDVPYFALSNKKQLSSIIKNSLSMNEVDAKAKDINSFSSKIFEMKKPVKSYVLEVLNEKYGIDVRKLDEVPSFQTLLMTEAEILSEIAKEAPADSVIQKTLVEFIDILSTKNGAESIDLSDFINEIFNKAGYTEALNEAQLMDYMDFSKVGDDLGKIGQVLKMLVPAVEKAAEEIEDQEEDMEDGESSEKEDGEDPLGVPDDMDSDSEVPMKDDKKDADDIAKEVKDEAEAEEAEAKDEDPQDDENEEDESEEDEPEEMDQDDLTSVLSSIEDLLKDLNGKDEDKEKDPEQYKS